MSTHRARRGPEEDDDRGGDADGKHAVGAAPRAITVA